MIGFTILVPTRHNSVGSFAAIAKENAADEGDHAPALYISRRDAPPCRALLLHEASAVDTRVSPCKGLLARRPFLRITPHNYAHSRSVVETRLALVLRGLNRGALG